MYIMVIRQKQIFNIADKCAHFMIKKHSNSCTVAFNGYPSGPATKNHSYNFTTKEGKIEPEVEVSAWSKLAVSKEEFANNNMNKQRFITSFLKCSNILV